MDSTHLSVVDELQRRRLMLPSIDDIINAFTGMTVQDMSAFLGIFLWMILLCLPLTGIDRRDGAVGVTYAFWLAAAGLVLVLAVPNRLSSIANASEHLILIATLATIAGIRWALRRRRSSAIDMTSHQTETK